jgi:PhnB protein
MKALQVYLNFDGNARDAMSFYRQALGGDLFVQTFKEAGAETPAEAGDRVMHARLHTGPVTLMASDTMPGMPYQLGNNFALSIECESIPEAEKLFAALGEGGKATMPLQDTFWGARFGMLTDKFGIGWMFNCELPKQG